MGLAGHAEFSTDTRSFRGGRQQAGEIRWARRGPRIPWGPIARHLALALFALVTLFPVAWVILLSLKSLPDANQNEIWPSAFEFGNYAYPLQKISTLTQNYWNSVFVTGSTVAITTICAVLTGYALVFLRPPGVAMVVGLLVASMFFPTRVTAIIAISEIQKDLDLLNVPAGLIFPYVTLSLALSAFIMRGMFQTAPREIFDAARMDGAGPLRNLLGIMLPMVKNGVVVVIIINFGVAWGEFLLSKTLNTTQSAQTLPVVLATGMRGMGAWGWPQIAAVYVMTIAPGLIAFALAQRWCIKGWQEGALKACCAPCGSGFSVNWTDTDPAASGIPINAAGDRVIEEIRNLTNAICAPKPDDVNEPKRLIASTKETDMDRGVLDRLYRLFSLSGNRRSALTALVVIALMGSAQAPTAAKAGRQKKKRRGKRSQKKRGASAQAKPGNHCIAPDGVDLNELYGMSSQFVTGFCKEVGSGEQWLAPGAPWFMSHGFDSVPDGFVPQGATPQEDFFAKFKEIKYVVDPGTKKEKTIVLPNERNLFKGEIDDFVVVSPSTLGDLHPLSVGKHTVETYWILSEMHCDGLADVIDENCIPAGATLWVRVRDFSVTPGHH